MGGLFLHHVYRRAVHCGTAVRVSAFGGRLLLSRLVTRNAHTNYHTLRWRFTRSLGALRNCGRRAR